MIDHITKFDIIMKTGKQAPAQDQRYWYNRFCEELGDPNRNKNGEQSMPRNELQRLALERFGMRI